MKGIFITFEGPDGAGKTTQIKSLAKSLEQDGLKVMLTREPGGTAISDLIRSILLSTEHDEMVDQAEVLLYAASRAQHVHQVILPALAKNKVILCDRFIDASIAYQAYGLGMEESVVRSINAFASAGLQPTRTYMLDIPVEESRRRLHSRAAQSDAFELDRIEQKEWDYHKRVREGFLSISRQEKSRILLLDASRESNDLSREILQDCRQIVQNGKE